MKHYCYRIDFEDGFVYFGVRSCRCQIASDSGYQGSPTTHAAKWLTDIPRVKTIVSVHATRELAEIAEDNLILDFWAVSKLLSLNATIRGAKFHRQGIKATGETRAKMSGKKWYTDGTTNLRLRPSDTVPEGFTPGRVKLTNECRAKLAGWKSYTDGTSSIHLHADDAVPEGFRPGLDDGTCVKRSEATAGSKLYTDGTTNLRLKASDVVPEGFTPGVADKTRAKIAKAVAGTQWYTDGATSIKLKPDDVIPEGFRLGRKASCKQCNKVNSLLTE